jgi:DNA polymerase-3 subunit gamma/tau
VTRLADAGVDLAAFLTVFADLLRAQLALLLGTETPDLSDRTRAALRAHRESWSPADVLRMLAAVTDLEPRFRKSGQQQLLVETLLVRCALLDRSVLLEDVLRSLVGKGGGGGPRLSAPVSPPAGSRTDPPMGPPALRAASPPSDDPIGGGSAAPSASNIPPAASPSARPGAVRSPAASDLVVGSPGTAMIDGRALLTRWPDIVTAVRRDRQAPVLAAALAQSTPEPGPEPGVVTLRLAERNAIVTRAITAGEGDILAALRSVWPEVGRIRVAEPEEPAAGGPRRLTVEAARAGDIAALRSHDAVLGAAIDALDLRLIE